jgi:iron complex transport system permease protein
MQQGSKQYRGAYPLLILLLFVVFVLSVCYGAVDISISEVLSALQKTFSASDTLSLNERIMMQIRLPRAVLCLFVGAVLAVGGTLMQALFRNPIVEPGLMGTSSGAAFGAGVYFVFSGIFKFNGGEWTLPVAAFAGGMLSTFLVFVLSERKETGRNSVITLLLTGIAINALFLSMVGFLAYIARDPQARSITFWNLGTLSGANWHSVIIVGGTAIVCILVALRYAGQLNILIMGEEEAQLLGVHIKKLKLIVLTINVVMIAVATAFVGIISFVGLVVPHLLRIWKGSDNRYLIIGSALLGGILLSAADIFARLILRPAELPIGIVTSIVGVPVFIFLLRKKNFYF